MSRTTQAVKKAKRIYVRHKPLTVEQRAENRRIALERLEKANQVKLQKQLEKVAEEAEKRFQYKDEAAFNKEIFKERVRRDILDPNSPIKTPKQAWESYRWTQEFATRQENMIHQIKTHITNDQRVLLRKILAEANGVTYVKQGIPWETFIYDSAVRGFVDRSYSVMVTLVEGRHSDESEFVQVSAL